MICCPNFDHPKIKIDNLSITGHKVWTSLKGEKSGKEKTLSFYETGFRFIDMKRSEKSSLKRFIAEITEKG